MIYTKNQLLEILEKYDDHDFLVGTLWSKLDVEYQLAEIRSELEYTDGVTEETIDNFNSYDFWDNYARDLDHFMEHDNSAYNDELYTAVLTKLKEN